MPPAAPFTLLPPLLLLLLLAAAFGPQHAAAQASCYGCSNCQLSSGSYSCTTCSTTTSSSCSGYYVNSCGRCTACSNLTRTCTGCVDTNCYNIDIDWAPVVTFWTLPIIIGITFGVGIPVLLVIGVLIWCCFRKRNQVSELPPTTAPGAPGAPGDVPMAPMPPPYYGPPAVAPYYGAPAYPGAPAYTGGPVTVTVTYPQASAPGQAPPPPQAYATGYPSAGPTGPPASYPPPPEAPKPDSQAIPTIEATR